MNKDPYIILIVILVAYSVYLSNVVVEGLDIKKELNKAKKAATKSATKIVKSSEKKMENLIKKSTKPLKKEMKKMGKTIQSQIKKAIIPLEKQINNVTKMITNKLKMLTDKIKNGVVDPILFTFKSVGTIFKHLFDLFMLVIKKLISLPTCILSYSIWTLNMIRIKIVDKVVPIILRKMLNFIFPDAVASTIHRIIIAIGEAIVNINIYLAKFFGIDQLFYENSCFNLTKESQDIVSKITGVGKNIQSNFTKNFGKF